MTVFALVFLLLLGAGCQPSRQLPPPAPESAPLPLPALTFPIEGYTERRTLKPFGVYVQDRFAGFHVGDDIEFTAPEDVGRRIPVMAIADGTVRLARWTSGYGGLVVIEHQIGERIIHALYGHLAMSSVSLRPGDTVQQGKELGVLGEGGTPETDGERKHLHFGLYEGDELRVSGYVPTQTAVQAWINPSDFLTTTKQ